MEYHQVNFRCCKMLNSYFVVLRKEKKNKEPTVHFITAWGDTLRQVSWQTLSQKYQKVKWKMNEDNLLGRMEEFFSSLWGSRSPSCINPGKQHCHWPEASPLQRLNFAATEGHKGVEHCYFTLIKCTLFREQKSRGPFLNPNSTHTREDPEIHAGMVQIHSHKLPYWCQHVNPWGLAWVMS